MVNERVIWKRNKKQLFNIITNNLVYRLINTIKYMIIIYINIINFKYI